MAHPVLLETLGSTSEPAAWVGSAVLWLYCEVFKIRWGLVTRGLLRLRTGAASSQENKIIQLFVLPRSHLSAYRESFLPDFAPVNQKQTWV